MQSLSQADCLALWEGGRALHPLDQGLLAVHTAFSESREAVADWPLGRRNQALAQLHCDNFGRWLRGWTGCAQCAEKLEFQLDGHALIASASQGHADSVSWAGSEFRLPNSRDLALIACAEDASSAALQLLRQCVIRTPVEVEAKGNARWSEEEIESIGERMAVADPLAEILLHFDCPLCGCSFDEALDLATFLWAEMEAQAKRLLRDVHDLALAYGWGETEILSISATRRNYYLEMVRS